MAKDIKKRFTVSLDIDTKDAEKQIKATVGNLKTILAEMGNASDKMTYFKDLAGYLSQIDAAMDAFKKKHGQGLFDKTFGGLDSNLRKELEGLFGVSGSQLDQIDVLREKLNALTPKSSIKEVRAFAKEINNLFTSVGRDAPFDNIDMEFSGRTRPEDIDRLSGAFSNFATVWDDVVRKIGKGFGVGPGGTVVGGLSKEVQAEVDKLQAQIIQLQALKKDLQTTLNNKHAFDNIEDIKLDTKPTEEEFKRLIKQYQDLTEASHNLMEGTNAYNSNLAQRAKIGLQISAIRDTDPDFDTKKASEIIDNDQFELVLDNFEKNIKKIYTSIDKEISKIQTKIEDTIASANTQSNTMNGFGGIDDSFKQAADASGKFVDKLEYIQLMATQIQRLFSTMSDEEVKLEYKILMNGQEINLKAGGAKEVGLATSIEALLGNLKTGTTVSMHNHPGGTSSKYNHFDLNEAISSFYSGTSKLSAIVGDDGITTLDLAKVKMEDALKVYEKLKNMKVSSISTDKLNKLFAEINSDYSNVAQHWDPSNFTKLAAYIYDVENSATSAITPLERFKNVVTMAFGKQINWDNYGQLLNEFDLDNVGNVFNQIAKMEGVKIHVDDTTTSSLDAVIEQINQQKQAFVELRQEANVTYQDIQKQVQAYLSEVAAGGTGNKALDYFKTYFGTADFLDITDLFAQLQDGILNPDNVANKIASFFPKIDPEEFVVASNVVAPIQDAKTALKEFFALADEIQHKSFLFGDAEGNVEIGRYTERLETAQSALIQFAQAGEYTKEELQEMESAFKSAQQRLSTYTTYYDGYGNGNGEYAYTYEEEYHTAERDKERLENDLKITEGQYKSEREENERLRTEIEELRQNEQRDENQGSVSESSIKEENEALKQQKSLVEEIVKIRNNLGLNASQTKLGVTDGKDWLGDSALDNVVKKQKELHGYVQWLTQIEAKEKSIGQLTDEEISKKQQLVEIVRDMDLSVRYKDGSYYSTANFGDYDQDLSEQIKQLNQVISLRKKIAYGSYWTGNYGTMGDTFSGDNISTLVGDSISQFESVQEFDASVIGQLVREYQFLHTEMTRCLTVGEQVPQSTLDRMKWFENIDATQLQNILPRLTELQSKIAAVQEGVEHNITTNADEQFYDTQIQNLQELIQLQKEYLSLGGPAETNDYDTSLHYSTEQLQERLDRYTQLKNGAKEVAKLQEAFPDIDFKRSRDFAYIADVLREGVINYQDALKQVNQELEKQKQLEKERASVQVTDETEEYKAEANAIEQRNEALKEGNALKAQEDTLNHSDVADTRLTTGTDVGKEDIAAEIQQLERLKAILLEVEQAVQAKTQAFRDEGLVVEQTVSREIEALRELVLALSYIKSAIDTINDSFTSRSVRHALPADSDADSENALVPTEVQNSYALETTLQTTNGYLKSILDTLSGNEAIDGLVDPLKNAVTELHNVANGIVEHQKRQQTDKTAASARIANNYGHLSSIANNAVTSIGDGSDDSVKIKGMKALADNVVRVEGAIRDASGSWNGFIVDIDEANQATISATNTQSVFAKELNETAEAAKKAAKSVQDAAKSQASSDIDALLAAGMQSRVDRANALSKAGQKVRRSALIIDGDQAFDNVLGGALVRDAYDTQALGQQMLSAGFTDADQFFDAMSQLAKNAVWTEQNIKSTWMHFASDKNLTFPNDGINKKLYASFDNVGILTVDWFNNFLTELTNRGYKGQIKIPHDITSFYDTDQIVGHAADDESWKILYDVLKTFAAKGDLRNIQAGIDATNPVIFGSKGAQGASFSELLEEIYKVAPGEVFDVEEITSIIRSAVESTTGALNEKLFKPIVDNVVNNRQSTQDEASRIADKVSKEVAKSAQDRTLQKITGQVNLEKGSLGFDFNARSLTDEQNEIVKAYDSLIAEMDKYEIAVKNGQQAELTGIEQTKQALFDKIDAYKQQYNIVNAGKTGNKKAPGATVVKNATTKYNALKNAANTEELQGSMVAQQKLDQYTAAYEKLINLQKQYKVGEVLSPDQEQEFNDARVACNNYAKEVEKMLKLHQKAKDEGDQSKRYEFEGDFQDTDVGRQQAFKEFLDQYDSSSVTFEKFDDNFNKMIYTVNNGDGTFTKMTATINSTRTAIDAFVGETKEAKGAFGAFFDELKGKFKSIGAYMIATVSIHDVIRVVRQGVQYVKEIDLALTELKKVTDETEQSYDNFLNTASQTASKIGSTVADFTNATADFARLGYSIEQATELAKAASVYKNVGDGINDIATASESIISTMKAFGIEADSAMGIVDRFNEVGKYIAQAA